MIGQFYSSHCWHSANYCSYRYTCYAAWMWCTCNQSHKVTLKLRHAHTVYNDNAVPVGFAVGNSETGRVEVVDVLPELDIVKILDICWS